MCNEMDGLFKPIVVITGFGPFVNHPVNASWEAVKLMNKEEIERKHNIELVRLEMSVTYQNVDEFVPALWDTHTPKLMIHVGVSGIADCIVLEMQAHRKGYQRLDYCHQCPSNNVCTAEGAMRLHTKLDVEQICKEFNENCDENSKVVPSKDAGRYVCEYIYYTSLSVDNSRSLFVHVPDMNVYPSEQTARGLERILELTLKQLKDEDSTTAVTDQLKETRLSEENKL